MEQPTVTCHIIFIVGVIQTQPQDWAVAEIVRSSQISANAPRHFFDCYVPTKSTLIYVTLIIFVTIIIIIIIIIISDNVHTQKGISLILINIFPHFCRNPIKNFSRDIVKAILILSWVDSPQSYEENMEVLLIVKLLELVA